MKDFDLYTDASSKIGFGIYFQGAWIAEVWPESLPYRSIQWKELFPIYVATVIWGKQWATKKILFHSDNQTVVDIWQHGSSTCPHINCLLCEIFLLTATYSFSINIVHVPGSSNTISDLLSCQQIEKFKALVPHANLDKTKSHGIYGESAEGNAAIQTNGHCFKHMQSIFNSSPPVLGLLCGGSLHCLPSSGRYPAIIHYFTLSSSLPTVTTNLSLRNPLLQHSTGLW